MHAVDPPPGWAEAAREVLDAYIARRYDDALSIVAASANDFGAAWLVCAMQRWIDWLNRHASGGVHPDDATIVAMNYETGELGGTLPDEIVWCSKLIKSRVEMDSDTFMQLIREWEALGKGRARGAYVQAVLQSCALTMSTFPEGYALMGHDQ